MHLICLEIWQVARCNFLYLLILSSSAQCLLYHECICVGKVEVFPTFLWFGLCNFLAVLSYFIKGFMFFLLILKSSVPNSSLSIFHSIVIDIQHFTSMVIFTELKNNAQKKWGGLKRRKKKGKSNILAKQSTCSIMH